MDRFKILKGVDPFANRPLDPCKFNIMGVDYRGWRIDDTSIVIEMPDNPLKFLSTIKGLKIEIHTKDKVEIFQGEQVKNSSYMNVRQKGKTRVHFSGKIIKVRTANYVLGKL
jgi:hypothetical protein